MLLEYTFYNNGKEYVYEFDADDMIVNDLIKDLMAQDGIDYYEASDCEIEEYIENAIDDITEYFYKDAYQEWQVSCISEYEYYGLNRKDYV